MQCNAMKAKGQQIQLLAFFRLSHYDLTFAKGLSTDL